MYSHPHGMRNSPNFKSGSEYLLPWMVNLTVNTEQWQKDMAFITANNPSTTSCIIGGEYSMSKLRNRRLENVVEGTNTEKVKVKWFTPKRRYTKFAFSYLSGLTMNAGKDIALWLNRPTRRCDTIGRMEHYW